MLSVDVQAVVVVSSMVLSVAFILPSHSTPRPRLLMTRPSVVISLAAGFRGYSCRWTFTWSSSASHPSSPKFARLYFVKESGVFCRRWSCAVYVARRRRQFSAQRTAPEIMRTMREGAVARPGSVTRAAAPAPPAPVVDYGRRATPLLRRSATRCSPPRSSYSAPRRRARRASCGRTRTFSATRASLRAILRFSPRRRPPRAARCARRMQPATRPCTTGYPATSRPRAGCR